MAVSLIRRGFVLILALTIIAATSKVHLQSMQDAEEFQNTPILRQEHLNINREGQISKKDGLFSLSNDLKHAIVIEGRNFNAGSIITDKYVILIKNDIRGRSLWKIDLQTIDYERIPFDFPEPTYSITTRSKLLDLGYGDIAMSYYQYLFILNNQTLQVKQTLQGHDQFDTIKEFYTYQDPQTNQTQFYVSRDVPQALTSELIRLPSGKYQTKEKIMLSWNSFAESSKLKDSVYLNGPNSGVYLENCVIKQIRTLDSIVSISYDQKNFFEKRTKVAVSYDESFFVLRSEAGFFEFYSIGANLEISRILSVFVSKEFSLIKKGATTTDDDFVFASMMNTRDQSDVAQINTSTGLYTFIAGSQIATKQILDFNLFHAKYNRFVTIEQRESNKYFLQLRFMKDLEIISEFPLSFDFPILEAKLVGSTEWDCTFAVALRISPQRLDQKNDTKLYLFKVQNDKIVGLDTSLDVSFNVLSACHKYIVNYKQMRTSISIFHFSNLTLAGQISVNTVSDYQFTFEKNFFILRDFTTVLYNFQQSLEKIGQLYTTNQFYSTKYYSVILANRGLLYQAPTQFRYAQTEPVTKIFFNISYLPFIKETVIQEATYAQSCEYAEYYLQPKQNCNLIFFINCLEEVEGMYCKGPRIVKYKECSAEREEYPIEGYSSHILDRMNFISSDKKFIIVILRPFNVKEILLEIRPIDKLDSIYFHTILGFTEATFTYLRDFYVDIIKGNLIMIRSPDYLTAYFIDSNQAEK